MGGKEVKGVHRDNSFEFPYKEKQQNGAVARWRCGIKKEFKSLRASEHIHMLMGCIKERERLVINETEGIMQRMKSSES